jgi:hypothetical protein
LKPSAYQIFAILCHLRRGDHEAVRIVASFHPACFAHFDARMRAAMVAGMAAALDAKE